MKTAFLDLDNTLIFSRRKSFSGEKIPVEHLYGRVQSYISRSLLDYLKEGHYKIVPITTRREEQFARIKVFGGEIPCPRALTCNGGILLVNGKIDEDWKNETMELTRDSREEVDRLTDIMEKMCTSVYPLHDLLTCFVAEDKDILYETLMETADTSVVDIYKAGRKVYAVAKGADKGTAIKRYKKRFGIKECVAAGDSLMDVSMLKLADAALAPESLKKGNRIGKHCTFCPIVYEGLEEFLRGEED